MTSATTAGHELFVYYRARHEDAQAVADAAIQMQSELSEACPGLRARLLCRPEARDGLHTWMETYALPDGLEVVSAAAAIERASEALAQWQVGSRNVEHFVACVS